MSNEDFDNFFGGIWSLHSKLRDLKSDLEEIKDKQTQSEQIQVNGIVTRELGVENYEDQLNGLIERLKPVGTRGEEPASADSSNSASPSKPSDAILLRALVQYLAERGLLNKDEFQTKLNSMLGK